MEIYDFPYARSALMAAAVILVLAATAAGCGGKHRAAGPVSIPARPVAEVESRTEEIDGIHHIIRPGQTLWRIARAYGVTMEEIAAANGIEDPTLITSGQPLFVPGAEEVLEIASYPDPPRATTGSSSTGDWLWPVAQGELLSYFGAPRRTHRHTGIDIRGARGQPVLAARSGKVVYSGATMRGYGKTIVIDHGDGYRTLYAHNDKLLVDVGRRVGHGEPIALVGRTGNASGAHCHFEIRKGDRPIDPLQYMAPPLEARR
jgi:murein DD-endopeptidase MepM/ murein hydrolase activator NlpD